MTTLVTFHVQPARVHEFESLHRALLQSMCAQNGCIEIRVHKSLKTPQEYLVYGTWESKEAWDRAHQTEEFRTNFQKLPIERHTLTSASFYEVVYVYNGIRR